MIKLQCIQNKFSLNFTKCQKSYTIWIVNLIASEQSTFSPFPIIIVMRVYPLLIYIVVCNSISNMHMTFLYTTQIEREVFSICSWLLLQPNPHCLQKLVIATLLFLFIFNQTLISIRLCWSEAMRRYISGMLCCCSGALLNYRKCIHPSDRYLRVGSSKTEQKPQFKIQHSEF